MLKIDYELIEKVREIGGTHNFNTMRFNGSVSYLEDFSRIAGIDIFLGKTIGDCYFFTAGGYAIAKIDEKMLDIDKFTRSKFYDLVAKYISVDKSYIDHLPMAIFEKEFCKKASHYYKETLYYQLKNDNKISLEDKRKIFKRDTKDIDFKLKKCNKARDKHYISINK